MCGGEKNSVIRSKIKECFSFQRYFNMPEIIVSSFLDSKEVMQIPLSAFNADRNSSKIKPCIILLSASGCGTINLFFFFLYSDRYTRKKRDYQNCHFAPLKAQFDLFRRLNDWTPLGGSPARQRSAIRQDNAQE